MHLRSSLARPAAPVLAVQPDRRRRYAYEDTHEWSADDYDEYDFSEDGGEKELTLFEAIGQNWQTAGLRLIELFATGCFLLMLLYCCCNSCCRYYCYQIKGCFPCCEYLTYCWSDPNYNRAKSLAEMMGLKLDYATYMKIKDTVELGVDQQMETQVNAAKADFMSNTFGIGGDGDDGDDGDDNDVDDDGNDDGDDDGNTMDEDANAAGNDSDDGDEDDNNDWDAGDNTNGDENSSEDKSSSGLASFK